MFLVFIAFGTMARLAPARGWYRPPGPRAVSSLRRAARLDGTRPAYCLRLSMWRQRCIYAAEVAPAVIRGRLLSIQLVANALGVILAYCVGLALVNQPSGWRFIVRLHRAAGSDLRLGPVAADGIAALANRRGSAQRGAPLLAAAFRH